MVFQFNYTRAFKNGMGVALTYYTLIFLDSLYAEPFSEETTAFLPETSGKSKLFLIIYKQPKIFKRSFHYYRGEGCFKQ